MTEQSIEAERELFAKHIETKQRSGSGGDAAIGSDASSSGSSTSSKRRRRHLRDLMRKDKSHSTNNNRPSSSSSSSVSSSSSRPQPPSTVQEATNAALDQQHRHTTKPKSWLARGLTSLMQLPNQTPTAVLRWTVPQGPMPHILSMPSRDAGRDVKLYVFIPPDVSEYPSTPPKTDASPNDLVRPSFDGVRRPCVIDFHGGGFVMGGPLEQAPWCAALARSGVVAISVHYRLGPTWEFPAALLDAEDTVHAVLDAEGRTDAGRYLRRQLFELSHGRIDIDETRVGLSGFSSGGNIALNMLLSIPSHLNFDRAGQDDGSDEEGNDKHAGAARTGEDWPSPFPSARTAPIPALLFFPSLDARQAPFERKRPEGMAPQGEVSKFVGRTLANAYLPRHMVGHLRASPGLAPIGMRGGMQAEVQVRQDAAHARGFEEAMSSDNAKRLAASSGDQDAAAPAKVVDSSNGSTASVRRSAAARHATQDCMHAATRALLILPSIDTLSEQSEVWVDALRAADKLVVSEEQDGSRIEAPLVNENACVRVHRIHGMGHGFTTYPDSFIDEKTRAAKKLVMEQARRYLISMWDTKK